jgi:tetratricopeptide (TPR) repeat protein
MIDCSQICFVIMPFGKKPVGEGEVDFDSIYEGIFAPAIKKVLLPEGGTLEPHRTDKDFFASIINVDMFEYLEYSRLAIADISGLNANVFYELGARHHTQESGTAIFRQAGATIPFDIQTIKIFPYEFGTPEKEDNARAFIATVLTESLARNRLDSPIRLALGCQQQQNDLIQGLLRDAEGALQKMDFNKAMELYREVIRLDSRNPLHRMKLGLLQKQEGLWNEAIGQFNAAVALSANYAEAWREKGIAENKLAFSLAQKTKVDPQTNPAPGEADLRRAIELNDNDFDAHASLGGVLKRAGRYEEARQCYARSREVSHDHPYPLLNEIKLRALLAKKLELTGDDRRSLQRAETIRELQVKAVPPYDCPWCFFDLAEIKLYGGQADAYVEFIHKGIESLSEAWQATTVRNSLGLLEPATASLPDLRRGLEVLDQYLAA